MPIAIILSPGDVIPAILSYEKDAELLAALRNLTFSPILEDVQAAREWLQTLDEPSGWFGSMTEANAYLHRLERESEISASGVTAARKKLGMSMEAFAAALGMGGNENTRAKRIWEIEAGRARLNPMATRKLRALLARRQPLDPALGHMAGNSGSGWLFPSTAYHQVSGSSAVPPSSPHKRATQKTLS